MAPTTPGDRLRDRRLAAGLTIDEAWADLRAALPRRYLPSPSKLQRMETETPEEKWEGIVIYGLAHVYRCKISDLSPMVADEYERLGDLLASSLRWIPTPTESGEMSVLVTDCDGQLELALAS